jgi:extracellular elastinolytic metalloproteinase
MRHVSRIAAACLGAALLTVATPAGSASAQERGDRPGAPPPAVVEYLQANHRALGLTSRDISDAVVSAQQRSRHNGVTHVSYQQQLDGIEVFAGVLKVNLAADGTVLSVRNRFVPDLAAKARDREPKVSAGAAVAAAARALGLEARQPEVKAQVGGTSRAVVFAPSGLSKRDIPARLVYLPRGNGPVRLAWDFPIETDDEHYWQFQVDAVTGLVLQRKNYVLNHGYKVYPIAAESPNHVEVLPPADGRTLVVDPEASGPSPLGWVTPGLLTTDGPNVQAQTDLDMNNAFTPGTDVKPVGTGLPTALTFAFPIDLTKDATTYREALVTNLFYWNNVCHDVHELYGFDEINYNFEGNDFVLADAQDGSGTNNANMLTLPDGVPPRMQMYLFTPPADLQVNSPYSALYNAGTAGFGQPLNETGVTGDLAAVNDGGGASTSDGCEPGTSWVGSYAGKIAFLDRGTCEFSTKMLHAQQAGAIAAVMVNTQSDDPISMSAGVDAPQVTIPSVSIGNASGIAIRQSLAGGSTVNVTMRSGTQPSRDSDFDAGVIAHEYGHGVSNRLTGDGVNVPFCLDGDQQAGEGWSDWWALAMTQQGATEVPSGRGIATYSLFQSTSGSGFRPYRYSTDMSINAQTYGDLTKGTLSVPHGVGTVWASALWDMYWALVRGVGDLNLPGLGFEPDVYKADSGKGNTTALQLVMDGLKLQGCTPNMLVSRDAILLADQQNNDGANQCHIWWAFARRGMGVNAMSNGTTLDVTEDFSLPAACQTGACQVPPLFKGVDAVMAPADGTCRLVVRWSAAEDNCETGQIRYNLYRSTDPLFVPTPESLVAASLSGTEYTDTDVDSGVEYFYIARAQDGTGNVERNLNRRSNVPVGSFSPDPDGLKDDAGDTSQHFATPAGQAGWTVRSSGGVAGSKVHATSAAGNYPDASCLTLESDIVYLGASPTLTFQSAWAIEPGWDGGIVEISTEAGGFSNWTKLDDVLYPGAMGGPLGNTSCANAGLADGERAFNGTSDGAFVPFSSNLSPWANQAVKVRFVFGSDAGTNDLGWLVDNITINDLRTAEACAPINHPPIARDDAAVTAINKSVTIDVLANDNDEDGDPLTVSATTSPSNGTATWSGGVVSYRPNRGFKGKDTFTYTISDGKGGADTASVTVTVGAKADR